MSCLAVWYCQYWQLASRACEALCVGQLCSRAEEFVRRSSHSFSLPRSWDVTSSPRSFATLRTLDLVHQTVISQASNLVAQCTFLQATFCRASVTQRCDCREGRCQRILSCLATSLAPIELCLDAVCRTSTKLLWSHCGRRAAHALSSRNPSTKHFAEACLQVDTPRESHRNTLLESVLP